MEAKTEKIALFIDGANLYATAKSLGFDIDYKRLLREFQSRGYLSVSYTHLRAHETDFGIEVSMTLHESNYGTQNEKNGPVH